VLFWHLVAMIWQQVANRVCHMQPIGSSAGCINAQRPTLATLGDAGKHWENSGLTATQTGGAYPAQKKLLTLAGRALASGQRITARKKDTFLCSAALVVFDDLWSARSLALLTQLETFTWLIGRLTVSQAQQVISNLLVAHPCQVRHSRASKHTTAQVPQGPNYAGGGTCATPVISVCWFAGLLGLLVPALPP
jgi:hypothetical protein